MNFLSILSYLKTLTDFSKYHPIISVGNKEIFEEYYDYYIIDGSLFILGISSTSVGSGGYKTLTLVNPNEITNVYIPDTLKVDLTKVTKVDNITNAAFGDKIKTIIEGCMINPNGFNLPYSNARFLVGYESIRVLESGFAINGNIVSMDINELNLGVIVGAEGIGKPMYNKYRVFTELPQIQAVTIPLIDLPYSPLATLVNDELITLSKNYLVSKFGTWGSGARPYEQMEYAKGDRVWTDVEVVSKSGNPDNERPEKRMWFVSLKNRNADIPLSKEAKANNSWAEYDPKTNKLKE